MSAGDKMFENLLFGMTIFLGIVVLINIEAIFGFMIWLFLLGVLQVLHSFVIALGYWKNEKIRKGIVVYWILAGVNLLVLFQAEMGITVGDLDYFGFVMFFLIMPLSLATYLWWFTLHFRKQKVLSEEAEAKMDQLEQQNHAS
jgi:hypothetical protein